jgi:hypothetical protein
MYRSTLIAACAGLAASQADPTLITDLPGYSGNSVMRSGYISEYGGCACLSRSIECLDGRAPL